MPSYDSIPIETDPDVITEEVMDALLERVENFDPKEAHLEVALIEVISRVNSETRILGKEVPDAIWRTFGQSMVGIAPVAQEHATTLSTWVMLDPAGYTVSDGTVVAFRVTGDELVSFQVVGDHVVDPGETTIEEVPLRAVRAGASENGYGPGEMELVDALSYVRTITAEAATSGGRDPETEQAYMDRLRDEMTLLTPRFVLASDAAVLARRIPGVHRALGIDNYNPVSNTYGNEKVVTVAIVDESGNALSIDVKNQVKNYLTEMREINFLVYVVDPTYTSINVTFSVQGYAGFGTDDLAERCRTALTTYLSPATWGGGEESPPTWRKEDGIVRYLEIAQVLNEVDGVHYVRTLTVNGNTNDVTLPGAAPLPTIGSLSGTAHVG